MFTIFFGTIITFFGVLPSIHFCDCSSANTAAWMVLLSASAGNSIVKRALPLKEIVYFTLSSFKYSSLNSGQCASHTEEVLPKASHYSSAKCGANGAKSTTRLLITALLRHFNEVNSLTQIIKALIEVL